MPGLHLPNGRGFLQLRFRGFTNGFGSSIELALRVRKRNSFPAIKPAEKFPINCQPSARPKLCALFYVSSWSHPGDATEERKKAFIGGKQSSQNLCFRCLKSHINLWSSFSSPSIHPSLESQQPVDVLKWWETFFMSLSLRHNRRV